MRFDSTSLLPHPSTPILAFDLRRLARFCIKLPSSCPPAAVARMEPPIPVAPLPVPSALSTSTTPSLAPTSRPILTKEEKQAARKAGKAVQLAAQVAAEGKGAANGGSASGNGGTAGARFLAREWGDVALRPGEEERAQEGGRKIMVMSWNVGWSCARVMEFRADMTVHVDASSGSRSYVHQLEVR